MGESEVKSLCALVLCRCHVFNLFLASQLGPCRLTALVPCDVVVLYQIEQNDVEAADAQQNLVAADVIWPVVFSVNICTDDVAGLHKHIVQGRRDRTRPDRVAVSRVPSDKDGVTVRI